MLYANTFNIEGKRGCGDSLLRMISIITVLYCILLFIIMLPSLSTLFRLVWLWQPVMRVCARTNMPLIFYCSYFSRISFLFIYRPPPVVSQGHLYIDALTHECTIYIGHSPDTYAHWVTLSQIVSDGHSTPDTETHRGRHGGLHVYAVSRRK